MLPVGNYLKVTNMAHQTLTAVQEDYLEVIYRLETEVAGRAVRISDIAAKLGTKPPTVTRAVRRLSALALLHHPLRGRVGLSAHGRKMAIEIVHRHEDIVSFFTGILGLRENEAESDACQIEHGLSARTAQRLHDFLEHFDSLTRVEKRRLTGFLKAGMRPNLDFQTLTRSRGNGWRT
jgi:DtxR family transcriptional regulator, Mn-dependent transcriptional regulator